MSTDIVALEKQYAKLRRKQHHACVVISGIKPARTESDVEKDNPNSPGGPPVPEEETNHVESSVAMVTLSVPLEVEKSNQDLTDPISPTVFGDTKCFFVQDLKKKGKDKHHQKHARRSSKTDSSLHQEKPNTFENGNDESTAHHKDNKKFKTKKVCFKDEIDNDNVKEINPEDSVEDIHNDEVATYDNDDCNGISENIEQRSETGADDLEGVENKSTSERYKENGQKNVHVETKVNTESDDIDGDVNNHGNITDNHSKVEPVSHSSGGDLNGTVQSDTTDKEEINATKTSSELDTNIVKPSRTHVLRNPSLNLSKQYYPSNQISQTKHRTKSESVENSNKQSIYQHFNLTKRQLSLDSALCGGNNKATQAKTIDFPFPVHSVNEHKIKAGMKLGLYDHTALEKLEKTRKIPKTKLPNLSFD